MNKNHGVQNLQTGMLEDLFASKIEAVELSNKLNCGSNTRNPDYRVVDVVVCVIFDSEREFVNS